MDNRPNNQRQVTTDNTRSSYISGGSSQGTGRSENRHFWQREKGDRKPKDRQKEGSRWRSNDKPKTISKGPNDAPEQVMTVTNIDLSNIEPLTAEQQAEENRRVLEAKRVIQTAEARKRHTDCISAEEGLLRQDRINKLESTNAGLQKQVDEFQGQLAEYQQVLLRVRPLFRVLRPLYQRSVDENGRQPPEWTLSFCLQQFEALENERIEQERSHQEQLKDLRDQINATINRVEDTKQSLGEAHRAAIAELIKKQGSDKEILVEQHNAKVEELKREITRMESGLMTNVDRFQPLPDSTFKTRFTDLKWAVESLARNLPEREGDFMARAFEETKFVRAHEFVQIAERKHWRFLLEGTFWHIIMCGLFATPFSIFGSYSTDYFDFWHDLFEQQYHKPEPSSEQWRSVTFETLKKQLERRPALKTSHDANLRSISEKLSQVLGIFSQNKPNEIGHIVNEAHRLAIDIGLQRSRLQLHAPELGTTVNRNTKACDDVNNTNASEIPRGVVRLIASPGLRRFGDARGYTFTEEPVPLVPAAVYMTAP